jgi:hypothetical protein
MATRHKVGKQKRNKPARRPEPVDDDLALADELLRVSRREQADLVAGFDKFLKQLGIRGKPIGGKKLQEMLLKRGFNPQSREFSQGIVEMREE